MGDLRDTKQGAEKQEAAIHVHASVVAVLDEVAEALESHGRRDLARLVDASANDLLEQRDDVLEWTGFDDVMKRSEDIADKISRDKIEPWNVGDLYDSVS